MNDGIPGDGAVTRIADKQRDEETIQALKSLLEKAEAGEIVGIAAVGLTNDGGVGHTFTSSMYDHLFTSIGAVAFLHKELLDQVE